MKAQARECIFEKFILNSPDTMHIEALLEAGQEATQVSTSVKLQIS